MNKSTHCCRGDKKLEESDDPVEFTIVPTLTSITQNHRCPALRFSSRWSVNVAPHSSDSRSLPPLRIRPTRPAKRSASVLRLCSCCESSSGVVCGGWRWAAIQPSGLRPRASAASFRTVYNASGISSRWLIRFLQGRSSLGKGDGLATFQRITCPEEFFSGRRCSDTASIVHQQATRLAHASVPQLRCFVPLWPY